MARSVGCIPFKGDIFFKGRPWSIAKVAIYGSKDLGSRIEIYDLSSCSTCARLSTDGGLWH